jgi:hypothetical protein
MIYQYNANTPQLAQAFLNNYRRPAPARDRSEGIKNIFGSINDTLDENKRKDLINSFGPSKTAEEMAARERYINTGDLSTMQNYLSRVDNAAYNQGQAKAADEQSNIIKRDDLKNNISALDVKAKNLQTELSKLPENSLEKEAKQAEIDANNSSRSTYQNAYNKLLGIDESTISTPTVSNEVPKDKEETKLINEATIGTMDATTLIQKPISNFEESAKKPANDKVSTYLTSGIGYDKAPTSQDEADQRETIKQQLITNGYDKAVTDKINTTYKAPVSKEQAKINQHNKDIKDFEAKVLETYNSDTALQGYNEMGKKDKLYFKIKVKLANGKLSPTEQDNAIDKVLKGK